MDEIKPYLTMTVITKTEYMIIVNDVLFHDLLWQST